jgi:hypothetical protein
MACGGRVSEIAVQLVGWIILFTSLLPKRKIVGAARVKKSAT